MQLQRVIGLLVTSVSVISLGVAGCTQQREFDAEAQKPTSMQTEQSQPSVPYVPTPNEVVKQMLQLANVSGEDVLYDLGSGDGRIPITAAQNYGTRATGVEINPELVEQSRENAQKAGVTERVRFLQQDLFQTDLSEATIVTLYLLPDVNLKLRSKLFQELKVVVHALSATTLIWGNGNLSEWCRYRVRVASTLFIPGLFLRIFLLICNKYNVL